MVDPAVTDAVRRGLTRTPKALDPFLFYDAPGSALFEEITHLPEYYPTRTERAILEASADALARELAGGARDLIRVYELGAGSAVKTELLLRALLARLGPERPLTYFPADVSRTPVEGARARMARSLPRLRVRPIVGTHVDALEQVARSPGRVAVLFLGGSIGNYPRGEAATLIGHVRRSMGRRGLFVLGVDHVKPLDVLLPAYDDSAGVTARFNRNVLARINRELDADFDVERFAHVALWNDAATAVEMHLESTARQAVYVRALGLSVTFERGERIHTESSHKYDAELVRALFDAAGMWEDAAFEDGRGWSSLRVARAKG
jgi:dimethylhistidine N-methyltransferase